jgi:hypothetical protein
MRSTGVDSLQWILMLESELPLATDFVDWFGEVIMWRERPADAFERLLANCDDAFLPQPTEPLIPRNMKEIRAKEIRASEHFTQSPFSGELKRVSTQC